MTRYEIGCYGERRFEIQETTDGAPTQRLAVVDRLVDAERIVEALKAWARVRKEP